MKIWVRKIVVVACFSVSFLGCNKVSDFFRIGAKVEIINSPFDFNLVKINDTINYTFKIKNLSNTDLILSDVETDSDCLLTSFTETSVKKDSFAFIKVKYTPTKIGNVEKVVMVVSNAKPRYAVLELKGKVIN